MNVHGVIHYAVFHPDDGATMPIVLETLKTRIGELASRIDTMLKHLLGTFGLVTRGV